MDWASHAAEVAGRALSGGRALQTLLSVPGLHVNHQNSINPTAHMETPHPAGAKKPNRWRESGKSLQTFSMVASPGLAKLLEVSAAPRGFFSPMDVPTPHLMAVPRASWVMQKHPRIPIPGVFQPLPGFQQQVKLHILPSLSIPAFGKLTATSAKLSLLQSCFPTSQSNIPMQHSSKIPLRARKSN